MLKAHKLARQSQDANFKAVKASSTQFFIDHHVVQSSTLAKIVTEGGAVVNDAIFDL